jgi:hypothetical protein
MRRTLVAVVVLVLLGAGLVAAQTPPNGRAVVDRVARETGTLIQTDSTAFTDTVCSALAATDGQWGRKVRRKGDWSSRNGDALAYRLGTEAEKALVDIVASSDSPDARPAWQVYPGPNAGNGYWMACPAAPKPPGTPTIPNPPADGALLARIAALESRVRAHETELGTQAAALAEATERLLAVAARVAVLESSGLPGIECIDVVVATSRDWGHGHRLTVPSCTVVSR